MNEPAAFRATFADWRTVKGRKQLQIILEVPLEQQGEVLKMLGAPDPSNPSWVAIARLQEPEKAQEPTKEKRRFSELPPSQQAAMRCNEPAFRSFVQHYTGLIPHRQERMSDESAACIKDFFGIGSRKELDKPHVAEQWRKMDDAYYGWQRGFE